MVFENPNTDTIAEEEKRWAADKELYEWSKNLMDSNKELYNAKLLEWRNYKKALAKADADGSAPPARPADPEIWTDKPPPEVCKPQAVLKLIKDTMYQFKLATLPDSIVEQFILFIQRLENDLARKPPEDPNDPEQMLATYSLHHKILPGRAYNKPIGLKTFVTLFHHTFVGDPGATERRYLFDEYQLYLLFSYLNNKACYADPQSILECFTSIQMQYTFAFKAWEASRPAQLKLMEVPEDRTDWPRYTLGEVLAGLPQSDLSKAAKAEREAAAEAKAAAEAAAGTSGGATSAGKKKAAGKTKKKGEGDTSASAKKGKKKVRTDKCQLQTVLCIARQSSCLRRRHKHLRQLPEMFTLCIALTVEELSISGWWHAYCKSASQTSDSDLIRFH